MLYWAEGSKLRNSVAFTNSDPDMLLFFVRFLREECDVADTRILLSVNCHLGNGLTVAEIESWWLDRLALPRSSLRKTMVNKPSKASLQRRNVLMYGTARVFVHSTELVQGIYGAIQEYCGIDHPRWLDCLPAAECAPRGLNSDLPL